MGRSTPDEDSSDSSSRTSRVLEHVRRELLLYSTVTGILLACVAGCVLRQFSLSSYAIYVIKFPGELMFRLLTMLIIPLVVLTIMSGVCTLQSGVGSGKIGVVALCYYIGTTICAAVLGLTLVLLAKPLTTPLANQGSSGQDQWARFQGNALDAIMDLLRNAVPSNVFLAPLERVTTQYETVVLQKAENVSNGGSVDSEVMRSLISVPGPNLIGLIVISVLFAMALNKLRGECERMIEMIQTLSRVVLLLVSWFMWTTPVGIFCLVLGNLLEAGDVSSMVRTVGVFCGIVVTGLFMHLSVTLTGLYVLVVRENPLSFLRAIAPAMVTAFGTSSSSATLPVTFHCLEERAGVNPAVSRLVLPLGTVINMDGGALYEALAAIYVAHILQFPLALSDYLTIVIASIASSIGAPSIPAAGMVTTILVFTSVGLPVEHIAIIYSVDWLLDRFRTMVNVCGDSFGCAVIQSLCRKELAEAAGYHQANEGNSSYNLKDNEMFLNGGISQSSI